MVRREGGYCQQSHALQDLSVNPTRFSLDMLFIYLTKAGTTED